MSISAIAPVSFRPSQSITPSTQESTSIGDRFLAAATERSGELTSIKDQITSIMSDPQALSDSATLRKFYELDKQQLLQVTADNTVARKFVTGVETLLKS